MGPDDPSETFRVLKTNEQRQFCEYRTQRLVLEAWDRLLGGEVEIVTRHQQSITDLMHQAFHACESG